MREEEMGRRRKEGRRGGTKAEDKGMKRHEKLIQMENKFNV